MSKIGENNNKKVQLSKKGTFKQFWVGSRVSTLDGGKVRCSYIYSVVVTSQIRIVLKFHFSCTLGGCQKYVKIEHKKGTVEQKRYSQTVKSSSSMNTSTLERKREDVLTSLFLHSYLCTLGGC